MQQITRVKLTDKNVEIDYEEDNNLQQKTRLSLVSEQDPTPAFRSAMQALDGDVAHLCEMSLSKDRPVKVRQVTFHYNDEGYTAVITGVRALTKNPGALTLNTPKVQTALESADAGKSGFMTDEMYERLESVKRAALDYIEGARAQMQLFGGEQLELADAV